MGKDEKFEYIKNKLKSLSSSDFSKFINEAPLKDFERNFINDIFHGFSYVELSEKYKMSTDSVGRRKHSIYAKLYNFEIDTINIQKQKEQDTKLEKVNIEKIINTKLEEAFYKKDQELKQKEEILNKQLSLLEKKLIQKKLDIISKQNNFNSRGTKKSVPLTIVSNQNDIKTETKAELRKKYIPMLAKGEISLMEASKILGLSVQRLSKLKRMYLCNDPNFSFENKHKGIVPVNKTPDEVIQKVISLYENKYKNSTLLNFRKILNEEYHISISKSTLDKILKDSGAKTSCSDKFLGKSRQTIGFDFLSVMEYFTKAIEKTELNDLEEFGLIELCDFAFNKAERTLNSISKMKEKLNFRTAYSVINHYIDMNYIDIGTEFYYWGLNHEKFSYTYRSDIKYQVINDIRNIYYPMFKKIEEYIIDFKKTY